MKRHLTQAVILAATLALTLGVHPQAFAFFDIEYRIDSFFDIEYDLQPIHVSSNGTAVVRVWDPPAGDPDFDTEMLSLSLTGLSPIGTVMIRESPTRQSLGRVAYGGDPDFDLLSFFDVFTELSVDGGQTWLYNEAPAHFSGASDSFFDITYRLDTDTQLFGSGHVTVLKAGSSMHASPEPSGLLALAGGLAPLGLVLRRAIKR